MFADRIAELIAARVYRPGQVAEAAAARGRAPALVDPGGHLVIVAADHPARGALGVGRQRLAMANRADLLERLCVALARPGVGGVLGSADVLEDLLLLGALEGKVVIGSMSRGGLAGSVFEIDDRFTTRRIRRRPPPSRPALMPSASWPAAASWPWSSRSSRTGVDGRVRDDRSPEAMIRAVSVASGLGSTSAYTWLKVPVVPQMEQVMAASTLPALLLGGAVPDDPQQAFAGWRKGRAIREGSPPCRRRPD